MKKLMDSRMIKKAPESSISKYPAPLPNIPSDMVFSSTKPSRRFPLGRDSGPCQDNYKGKRAKGLIYVKIKPPGNRDTGGD